MLVVTKRSLMMIEQHRFYIVREVAEIQRVSPKTVWYRVRQGHLPPLDTAGGYGRKTGYPGWKLLELLEGKRPKA